MDAGVLATVVTGGVGSVALCVSRCKRLCHCTGCCRHFESCKFGFLANAIVDTHEVEFKKINANGNDLTYVSTHAVNVNDSDDDHHTDPPSDFVPVNENSRNNRP